MASSPLYFSETLTVGKRTYLMEVRRTQRGEKYFIIKRTDLRDEDQEPVIVYEHSMLHFARAIDRATRAVVNTVPEVEPADERKFQKEQTKQKAATRKKERPNQGRRWTDEHDSLLIIHYKNGMSTDELAKLLGRGEFSIGVRLLKLGLGQPKS